MNNIQLAVDVRNQIAECPIWSAQEQALYWEDILEPAIYRWLPATDALTKWPMPEIIGSFGLRSKGGMVVALRSGLYFFNPETAEFSFITDPEPDMPGNRLNDGKVSPEGRFWVGSMNDVPVGTDCDPTGSLYRLDPDGSCHRVLTGIYCSNGLAWSPDGLTMYFSDSRGPYIQAFDYDPGSGDISNGRIIARPDEKEGRPDGAGMDEEGSYWSAGVSAGCMNRYRGDGTLLEKIKVPTPSPTMCCFGGPDRRTMYITSHRSKLEALHEYPTAGGIFAMRVQVPGVLDALFAG